MNADRSQPPLLVAILAAGEARRFGRPKLLSRVGGKTLLQHCQHRLQRALPATPTVVITGRFHHRLQRSHRRPHTRFVRNAQWQTGMGSSLKCAAAVAQQQNAAAMLLVLADQVALAPHHFSRMTARCRRSPARLAATRHRRALGPPALFGEEYYQALMGIANNRGARSLLLKHRQQLAVYSSRRAIDIDTRRDLKRWRASQSSQTSSQ